MGHAIRKDKIEISKKKVCQKGEPCSKITLRLIYRRVQSLF